MGRYNSRKYSRKYGWRRRRQLKAAERKRDSEYQIAVVKKEVLDDLIEVKYEGDDSNPLYPFVQLDTSPEEPQVATLYADVDPQPDCSEPPQKRPRASELEDGMLDEVECLTSDVFVDNPMADGAEDEARALGEFVAAEMSRIRSDVRRKALKKTIEEAIKAMVEEDEREYFQDPDIDPLS
uniref:Uncharacterized protein n=1 Tax=Lygus hesperus TaxID=30085 RepID=A0A146L7M6_LYGHE